MKQVSTPRVIQVSVGPRMASITGLPWHGPMVISGWKKATIAVIQVICTVQQVWTP